MSRGLTSAMKAAVTAKEVFPVMFGWFDFFGGAVFVHTGYQPITWNSSIWLGLGYFVSVQGGVNETADVNANSVTFQLSGIPSNLLGELFTNRSRGRGCKLWFGCFNKTGTLLADPQVIFAGRMDQPSIVDQGDTSLISLTAESRLVDLQRPRERRFTDQDQKTYYPADNFFKFVAGLQDRKILWGSGTSSGGVDGNTSTGGNDGPGLYTGGGTGGRGGAYGGQGNDPSLPRIYQDT